MRWLALMLFCFPILVFSADSSSAGSRILVHGHRGARARMPENTIPAFQYAIEAGADFLELDVAVTKDNILVVSHDPVLHAPVCSTPAKSAVIRELTLAQVREYDCGAVQNPAFKEQKAVPGTRIPTLDEVLALGDTNPRIRFNIETKISPDKPEYTPEPREFSRMVLEVIRKHHLEKRVIVQSFDYRTLHAMKELAPEIRMSALTATDKRDFASIARDAHTTVVSPHFMLVTPEKVKAAHDAGLEVVPWTANAVKEWEPLAAANVDAIITDDPATLISFLKERGRR